MNKNKIVDSTDSKEARGRALESAREWYEREVWAEGDCKGEQPENPEAEMYPYVQGHLAGQSHPSPEVVEGMRKEERARIKEKAGLYCACGAKLAVRRWRR